MLYRVSVAAVVAFWLLMATLLVRTELFPDRGSSMPVPLDYVVRMVYRHEQSSDLVLYNQRRRLDGNFHFQPKRLPGGNLLDVSGNFLLSLPGVPGRRVVFHGALETDDHERVTHLDLSVSLHEPKQSTPGLTLHLTGLPEQNQWHYQLMQGGATLREGGGTPEEILAGLDIGSFGIDPKVLSQVGTQASAVTFSAHRGVLRINQEDIEALVIQFHHGEQLEMTIYVNQLGQILGVKTFLGYDLYDESLAP